MLGDISEASQATWEFKSVKSARAMAEAGVWLTGPVIRDAAFLIACSMLTPPPNPKYDFPICYPLKVFN